MNDERDDLQPGAVVVLTHRGEPLPGAGTIISRRPRDEFGDYIVVCWGEDEDGILTGGWFVSEPVPLLVVAEAGASVTVLEQAFATHARPRNRA